MVKIIPAPLSYRRTYRTSLLSMYISGSLNPSASITLFTITAKGVLHGFQFQYDGVLLVHGEIKIIVDGITIIDMTGTGIVALFSPGADMTVPNYGFPWSILHFDTTNNRYSFAFKGPIKFNSSLEITLINNSDTDSMNFRFQPLLETAI